MIRLAIAGASGRMGRCVVELAGRDPRFEVAARLDRSARRTLPSCDVVVEFAGAAGCMEWLEASVPRGVPMVIGSTGHDDSQLARIAEAAKTMAIVKAANFSAGVQTLLKLAGQLTRALGDGYDVEIVDTHHRNKVDAPSGTALALADEIRRNLDPSRDRKGAGPEVICGRQGRTGQRPSGQIAIHALRMGDVIGQHEIHFSGPGETVTIRHTAHSRDAFAAGALRAAAWVIGKPSRLYTFADVLES